MNQEYVRDNVIGLITLKTDLQARDIVESMSLSDDLGLDSLDKIELAMDIETKFNVIIQDGEYAHIKTVKDVINEVSSKLG